MTTRAGLAVAALGTASSLFAQTGQPQTQGTITWNLSYFVATPSTPGNWASGVTIATTPGGTVGPNQAALFRLRFNLSLTPGSPVAEDIPMGSPLTWDSTLGGSGAGHLGGLWCGDLNVNASEATGGWTNSDPIAFPSSIRRRTLSPYATGGGFGLINGNVAGTDPSGAVTDIQPAQFGDDAALLDHGNELEAWRGLWIPANYSPRSVGFMVSIGTLGFLSQVYASDQNYGTGGYSNLPIALNVATLFGPSANVNIVPGPSSLALLG